MDKEGQIGEARAKAVAKDLGVSVDLLDEVQWDVYQRTGNSGTPYGYYVEFEEDTPRELLERLGVRADEFSVDLRAGFGEEPEPDDPNEHVAYLAHRYKQLGGANGAVKIGDVVLLNPWSPSAPAAQEFWDQNIGILPVEDRQPFLIELLRHS
ncbi:hypothetical protein OE766_05475 [Pararhizobium sp. YC-54]|uniref:hypothetical protein n=1 Tax=Pararhizobium sp. YC-54 TaxID=2986920 RepID=UPI0021F6C956|nr:hypothetical protein [Pararhizobium sp. YC-54]MCV9997690.1 hypothetical protein [Pararhizobium sp. YC-54]